MCRVREINLFVSSWSSSTGIAPSADRQEISDCFVVFRQVIMWVSPHWIFVSAIVLYCHCRRRYCHCHYHYNYTEDSHIIFATFHKPERGANMGCGYYVLLCWCNAKPRFNWPTSNIVKNKCVCDQLPFSSRHTYIIFHIHCTSIHHFWSNPLYASYVWWHAYFCNCFCARKSHQP